MSLYERFAGKNEAAFRREFVKPLLDKSGFFLVTDYHGNREHGKDFVFSELHRFGLMKYCGAQVKHENRIALGQIHGLLEDINEAFDNPFTLPDTQEEMYISTFYIFNSGDITDDAKESFNNRVIRTKYRGNVHLLCGERLDWLNKWATFQNDQSIRSRLVGLRNQLTINIEIWNSIKEDAEKAEFSESRGSILSGIEGFLSVPTLPQFISQNELMQIWQLARIIDSVSSRYYMGAFGVRIGNEGIETKVIKQDLDNLILLTDKAKSFALKVVSDIDAALSELKPI